MKRAFKIVFAIVFMFLSVVSFSFGANNRAVALESASTDYIRGTAYEYLLNLVEYKGSTRKYIDRRAGTLAEYLTANYLAAQLELLGLEAKTHSEDSSILEALDGFQEFNFKDVYTGEKEKSYNVVYTIKGVSSNKKVVISANYDNYYYGYLSQEDQIIEEGEDFSDGINASAASVAVLLTLAEVLPQNYFNFDIEIVFFGAGYNNNAGAKFYNQTMNSAEREKTLLMLDVSRIALGDDVYYYAGAFKTEQDDFYANTLTLEKFEHGLQGVSVEDEDTMLGYLNAGYSSSTAVFEGSGLNVLHIFAGSYKEGIFSGYCEYVGKVDIANTQYDSVDYILNNYNHDLTDNMTLAAENIINLLDSNSFVNELSTKPSTWQYKIFSANGYVLQLMLIILIILMIVAVVIHYGISKKSYKYVSDNKISAVMLQIDEDDKTSTKK